MKEEEIKLIINDLENQIIEKKNTLEVRNQFHEFFDDNNTRQLYKEIKLSSKILTMLKDYQKIRKAKEAADAFYR